MTFSLDVPALLNEIRRTAPSAHLGPEGGTWSLLPLAGQGRRSSLFRLWPHGFVVKVRPKSTIGREVASPREQFLKEVWAHTIVATVPVPKNVGWEPHEIQVESGEGIVQLGYCVRQYVDGLPACFAVRRDEYSDFMFRLGGLARRIGETPTVGFGVRQEPEAVRFQYATWSVWLEFLKRECERSIETQFGSSDLVVGTLPSRLEALRDCSGPSRLFHGDLGGNWGNVLVRRTLNGDFEVASIIDWEHCGSGPEPYFEFATTKAKLAMLGVDYERGGDSFRRFVQGYGMSWDWYTKHIAYRVDSLTSFFLLRQLQIWDSMVMRIREEPRQVGRWKARAREAILRILR